MALLLVLGPGLLPEFRDPAAGRLDLGSAALSLAAVLAAIYGLKQLAQDGPGWLARPGAGLLAAASQHLHQAPMVGATGFEPVTPSVAAIRREPPC